jgi:hypothetical protein
MPGTEVGLSRALAVDHKRQQPASPDQPMPGTARRALIALIKDCFAEGKFYVDSPRRDPRRELTLVGGPSIDRLRAATSPWLADRRVIVGGRVCTPQVLLRISSGSCRPG